MVNNMKKHIYVFATLLCFLFAGKLFAVNDSCLALYCPNDGVNFNPDYICIDTCMESPTFGDWFQKGTWTIGFKKYFFRDSMNDGTSRHLKDLDSMNFPETYTEFKILEDKFGKITFVRNYDVCSNDRDSSFQNEPCLNIYFNKINRTKDVEYYLGKLQEIRFVRMANYPLKSKISATCLTEIWPHNPPNSYNPDHILKDTCIDSPTYGKRYQKGTFCIALDYYVFDHLIALAYGSTIDNIDSVNHKDFKDSCKSLEKRFGKISFYRDPDICLNRNDTAFVLYPCLAVHFSQYNLTDSEYEGLGNLPGVGGAIWFRYTPSKSDIEDINTPVNLKIEPNPCIDKIKILNIETIFLIYRKLIVYNYLGNIVLSFDLQHGENEYEIDVSFLDEGIYFIKINNKILKFIKLR